MSERPDRIRTRLLDMRENAELIGSFVAGYDEQSFYRDRKTVLAVLRALQIIGEAANQLPTELHARYPGVPWRPIIATRHILVHGYDVVDESLMWKTATTQLAPLRVEIDAILADLDRTDGV